MSRLRFLPHAGALGVMLALLVVGTGGCGSSAASGPGSSTATASLHADGAAPTLPADAVAYLPSRRKPLDAAFLAREAQAPALSAALVRWGYYGGEDRYFQGESRKLQLVDSRTLRFRSRSGASGYVDFMRGHLNAYLGSYPKLHRFSSLGRTGFLATGQECQCHLANPAFLAAVAGQGTVTWLEINGPGATRRTLRSLIAQAP